MTVLHAADLHLDSPMLGLERYDGLPEGLAETLRTAARRAFDRLAALALAERPAAVLIAGDAYDGEWKDFNTPLFFAARLKQLADAGIPVVMIAGNHDAANRNTRSLRLPSGVRLLSAERPESYAVPNTELVVHGQGFATREVRDNLALRYPAAVGGAVNIGLLHTALAGAEGHEPYAPCTVADLRAKNYDYWALGHIHQRQHIDGDPRIVFPGNLQGRHARETGPKGCVLVRFGAGAPAVEFRELDVARWEHAHATALADDTPEAALDRLADACRTTLARQNGLPTMLRATLAGATAAHHALLGDRDRWTAELRSQMQGDQVWIEKVRFDTAPPPHEGAGPLRELWNLLAEAAAEPAARTELAAELEPLARKLPAPADAAREDFRPDDPAWQDEVFAEALAVLRRNLNAGAA